MMHRDLKSPNVLLSEEGVAKIADVGMVRAQVKDLVTAQPVMTPLWAAPEVCLCPEWRNHMVLEVFPAYACPRTKCAGGSGCMKILIVQFLFLGSKSYIKAHYFYQDC